MLGSAWNGENLRLGRMLPRPPQDVLEGLTLGVGCLVSMAALALFLGAWRTLGAARVGFVAEFIRPESLSPLRRGPYRRVRHPLFWSGIGVSWAAALLCGTATGFEIAAVNTLYGLAYNRLEDRRLIGVFGDRYASYAREVPRILGGRARLEELGAETRGDVGAGTGSGPTAAGWRLGRRACHTECRRTRPS